MKKITEKHGENHPNSENLGGFSIPEDVRESLVKAMRDGQISMSEARYVTMDLARESDFSTITKIIPIADPREKELLEANSRYVTRYRQAEATVAALSQFIANRQSSIDGAIKAWQEKTGQDLEVPSDIDLIGWLLDEVVRLRGENGQASSQPDSRA